MASDVSKHRYSIADYLTRERSAYDQHEYRDGEILLMAGGSADHHLVTLNVGGELPSILKGKPCQVYDFNLRVRIPRTVLSTPRVETFYRAPAHAPTPNADPAAATAAERTWLISTTNGTSASAQLLSLGVALPLAEIYRGLEFAQPATDY